MGERTRTRWGPNLAPPVVWLVGRWTDGEFAIVRQSLDALESPRELAALDEALAALAERPTESPEVLLLAQVRPGCWQQTEIDRLQILAPLARVVIVAGAWCEGERRTGRPLVGAARLYWHEVPAWWQHSVARRAAGVTPLWSANSGVMEPTHNAAAIDSATGRKLVIDARDFATYEALVAALHPTGWKCVWTPRGRGEASGAIAGIWDGGQLEPDELTSLRDFCGRFGAGAAPVIALVDFPRPEHFAQLQEAGAAALLGKPYSVASLFDEVERAVAKSRLATAPAAAQFA